MKSSAGAAINTVRSPPMIPWGDFLPGGERPDGLRLPVEQDICGPGKSIGVPATSSPLEPGGEFGKHRPGSPLVLRLKAAQSLVTRRYDLEIASRCRAQIGP